MHALIITFLVLVMAACWFTIVTVVALWWNERHMPKAETSSKFDPPGIRPWAATIPRPYVCKELPGPGYSLYTETCRFVQGHGGPHSWENPS